MRFLNTNSGKFSLLAALALGATSLTPADAETFTGDAKLRHDYKMGFKYPMDINGEIPYWRTYGSTVNKDYYIQLAPNVTNQQGSMWSTRTNIHANWVANFTFYIAGTHKYGSNGMALWYTANEGRSGNLYGNENPFKGLGLIFHTYNEHEHKPSPFVMAYINDGHTRIDVGGTTHDHHMVGACFRDVRNTHPHLVHARLTYDNHKLSLELDTTQDGRKMIKCFEAPNVDLPIGYRFGFSAMSGEKPDNHDVNSFDLFELHPKPKITYHSEKMHHMDQKIQEEVEQAHHEMEEIHEHERHHKEKDEFGNDLDDFASTQDHILDALEELHAKLDMAGFHGSMPVGDHHEDKSQPPTLIKLHQDIQQLGREVGAIKTVVDQLALEHHVPPSHQSEVLLSKLDHIHRVLTELEEGHDDLHHMHRALHHSTLEGHHHWSPLVWVSVVLAAQALCLVLYNFFRQRGQMEKKYF
ncbi:hypothetical protein IWQ61_006141 [Dispira simplex]|nr:hypothetical protein IWQ61_006141 [Dispira simplex]